MYAAMVVEDSKPILRNLVSQIEAVCDRIEVVATALNGSDALNKLSRTKLDIIFSDIKMPMMDGLEFLAKAKQQDPNLKCIIVSGYDDFEFARQAIQLRVDEYILKPVVDTELGPLLSRIVGSLDVEKQKQFERDLSSALRRGDRKFRPTSDFLDGPFGVCLIRSGHLRNGVFAPNPAYSAAQFWKSCAAESGLAFVETRHCSELAVIANHKYISEKGWRDACVSVYRSMSRHHNIDGIAYSSGQVDPAELPAHVCDLSDRLDEQVLLEEPVLLSAGETPLAPGSRLSHDDIVRFREEARFISGSASLEEFKRHTERAVHSWRDRRVPLIAVHEFVDSILDALFEIANATTRDDGKLPNSNDLLERSNTYDDLTVQLSQVYGDVMERKKNGCMTPRQIANSAIAFFRANVHRNISMTDVATKLGVSPSYVHRILRAALGSPPMEYYTNLKIEEAKHLIELYPDRMLKDIAKSLGFQDQHYFSRVFKSHVSLSPVEYRKMCSRSKMV